MPNTSVLLDRLNNATPTYANVTIPGRLIIDSNGYLVTVSNTEGSIYRFHPDNLTRIDQTASPVFLDSSCTLVYRNGAYYVGFSQYILVLDSSNMTIMNNISTEDSSHPGDIIFLNDGQQMIATSPQNNRLLFFNRSSVMPYDYYFTNYQNIVGQFPHGLHYVNDTLFYVTSRDSKTLSALSNAGNTTAWIETPFLNVSWIPNSGYAFNMAMDDCSRIWLSVGTLGVRIFNDQGSPLGTLQLANFSAYDTLIVDNYVVYLSSRDSHQIVRIDPHIQC